MTIDQARLIAALLKTLEDAKSWRECFEDEGQAFIAFEEIVEANNIDAGGTRGGWDGGLHMTRLTAAAMMKWLEEYVTAELAGFGVK